MYPINQGSKGSLPKQTPCYPYENAETGFSLVGLCRYEYGCAHNHLCAHVFRESILSKRDLPLGNRPTNQHEEANPAHANWIQMLKSFTLIQDIIKETWVSQCRRRLHAD